MQKSQKKFKRKKKKISVESLSQPTKEPLSIFINGIHQPIDHKLLFSPFELRNIDL